MRHSRNGSAPRVRACRLRGYGPSGRCASTLRRCRAMGISALPAVDSYARPGGGALTGRPARAGAYMGGPGGGPASFQGAGSVYGYPVRRVSVVRSVCTDRSGEPDGQVNLRCSGRPTVSRAASIGRPVRPRFGRPVLVRPLCGSNRSVRSAPYTVGRAIRGLPSAMPPGFPIRRTPHMGTATVFPSPGGLPPPPPPAPPPRPVPSPWGPHRSRRRERMRRHRTQSTSLSPAPPAPRSAHQCACWMPEEAAALSDWGTAAAWWQGRDG